MLIFLVVAAWFLGPIALVGLLIRQDAQGLAEWASVVGALTALAGFVTPFAIRAVSRLRSRREGPPSQSALAAAADELATALQLQWRDEARRRRLQDPWPLSVRWRAADLDLADHEELVFPPGHPPLALAGAAGRAGLSGRLSDVVDAYELLPYRRLVVLGAPGSGKSVLAMTLTQGLLDRRQAGAPVPVLFAAGSWDPSRAGLHDWMVDYLSENYELSGREDQGGRSVAEALVAGNRLVPILDGLDEMPSALRPLAISEINRALDPRQPIVVTCRTEEYREAVENGDVLTLAAVVELEPLDPATVVQYLTETTPAGVRAERWRPVFDRLRTEPNGVLASVLSTPLMVSLARTIYGDNPGDPSELLDRRFHDRAALEDHLLDMLIPATYRERPSRSTGASRWGAAEVTSWLTHLARHVAHPGRSEVGWWQLESSLPKIMRGMIGALAAGAVVAVVFGLAAGVAFVITVLVARALSVSPPTLEAWLQGRLDRWLRRLQTRSAVGRFAAALAGVGETTPIERRVALTLGRFTALLAGLTEGLIVNRHGNLYRATAEGLAVALAVGLAVGFFTVSPRTTPSEVRFDARKGLGVFLRHLAIGVVAGVCAGVGFGILLGSGFGITVGVALGMVTGLIDGLVVWLDVSADVTRARSPRSTRRADRLAALARGATVGVAIGVTSGLAFGLAYGPESGLLHAAAFGVGYAIADPYFGLSSTLWGRYLVANAWLALAGRVPWRLMAFLEDAHEHGLLRRAGATYQFRHIRLQQRLAASAR